MTSQGKCLAAILVAMIINIAGILGPGLFNLDFDSLHHIFWHCLALKGRLCHSQRFEVDLCPDIHNKNATCERNRGWEGLKFHLELF